MNVLLILLEEGACRDADPDMFHPDREIGRAAAEPKSLCSACPVTRQCLAYAIAEGATGIWGNTTTRERDRMARDRRRTESA